MEDFESNGDVSHDRFASTVDGNPVVLSYRNFTVNAGHLVTTTNRCKGLYLYIAGDLTVNGTLSMTARGANAVGKYVVTKIKRQTKRILFFNQNFSATRLRHHYKNIIYPTGGKGTVSTSGVGVNGACGSGGFSYNPYRSKGARGGYGTSFSGGAGAGGCYILTGMNIYNLMPGKDNGGAGGNGYYYATDKYSGGGAGNPGGTCSNLAVARGSSGTGGLLILIVEGQVNITGSITSCGSKGGQGSYYVQTTGGWYSGAGSGGGAVHIFSKNIASIDKTKINVSGGAAGNNINNGPASGAGGKGTIKLVQI